MRSILVPAIRPRFLVPMHFVGCGTPFRGTATGGGTTRETNQRLALCWLSHEWSSSKEHNGAADGKDALLDAAIVGEAAHVLALQSWS